MRYHNLPRPIAGELCSGWLERCAHKLGEDRDDILQILGVCGSRTLPAELDFLDAKTLTHQVEAIAGVPRGTFARKSWLRDQGMSPKVCHDQRSMCFKCQLEHISDWRELKGHPPFINHDAVDPLKLVCSKHKIDLVQATKANMGVLHYIMELKHTSNSREWQSYKDRMLVPAEAFYRVTKPLTTFQKHYCRSEYAADTRSGKGAFHEILSYVSGSFGNQGYLGYIRNWVRVIEHHAQLQSSKDRRGYYSGRVHTQHGLWMTQEIQKSALCRANSLRDISHVRARRMLVYLAIHIAAGLDPNRPSHSVIREYMSIDGGRLNLKKWPDDVRCFLANLAAESLRSANIKLKPIEHDDLTVNWIKLPW